MELCRKYSVHHAMSSSDNCVRQPTKAVVSRDAAVASPRTWYTCSIASSVSHGMLPLFTHKNRVLRIQVVYCQRPIGKSKKKRVMCFLFDGDCPMGPPNARQGIPSHQPIGSWGRFSPTFSMPAPMAPSL